MLPEVPGILSAPQVAATARTIARWQLPSGLIPWFPDGHGDPWNHVESAMALATCGHRAQAERAYEWLAHHQRPDGSWHQYYREHEVEQDKLDANVIAYCATGAWHHWLLHRDRAFLGEMWPVVERAIEFVLELQTPRGEILWARHIDGTPWPFALLTSSSSISHSLRCATAMAAEMGEDRPDWELASARLAHTIRHRREEAFAPKHRWAMDWYYPVLTGVVTAEEGRDRLADRFDTFVLHGEGVRCVSDRPWVTAAETCEAALAHLAVGDRTTALELFSWAQEMREPDGRYITGLVHPDRALFPPGERSTYSAAAAILAADAIGDCTPAAGLFRDHDLLPAIIDVDPDQIDAPARD